MPMTLPSAFRYRLVNLYIFLFCAALLGIAMYMEHVMMLEPCPLCITQRLFFIACGLVALIAFGHNPARRGQKIYGFTSAALALGGGAFAMRQIWLQNLPEDEVPACGPSLSYMMEVFPWQEVVATMFTGDGNCAEVSWRDPVIGMSIAQWSLVGFILLALVCVWQGLRRR